MSINNPFPWMNKNFPWQNQHPNFISQAFDRKVFLKCFLQLPISIRQPLINNDLLILQNVRENFIYILVNFKGVFGAELLGACSLQLLTKSSQENKKFCSTLRAFSLQLLTKSYKLEATSSSFQILLIYYINLTKFIFTIFIFIHMSFYVILHILKASSQLCRTLPYK